MSLGGREPRGVHNSNGYDILVPGEPPHPLILLDIPNPHPPIPPRASQKRPISANCQRENLARVTVRLSRVLCLPFPFRLCRPPVCGWSEFVKRVQLGPGGEVPFDDGPFLSGGEKEGS